MSSGLYNSLLFKYYIVFYQRKNAGQKACRTLLIDDDDKCPQALFCSGLYAMAG